MDYPVLLLFVPSCASLTFGQEGGVTGERNFLERNLLLHKSDEDVLLHLG